MKYLNTLRNLVIASFIGASSVAGAQTAHPLAFPATATGSSDNWYKDYVGVRFQVTAPSVIAGSKLYTTANDGSGGTTMWGGAPVVMIDQPVKFAPAPDTNACSATAWAAGSFTGKIALIWRGTCEFGAKALKAQQAGAEAVVLVNNVSGGPVGMGAGASGASVTIPVYMVSLEDGTAMANQLNNGVTVTMTILLDWLSGHANDVGFAPEGYSLSAYNCLPRTQMNTHAAAYKGLDGGFVCNFGTHTATNVKVAADLSFTPTGGSATTVHSDSISLASFPTIDSIWAMFAPTYDLPTAATNGRFDLNYRISSDSTDGFPGDNAASYSFYATDSLYSKGRYDFANNRPYCAMYTGPGGTNPYVWGVPYYIANGGDFFDKVQFSVSSGPGLLNGLITVYVFKWVDGSGSVATPDSFMENDELTLIGSGVRAFDGITDSSFQFFSVNINGDTLGATYIPVPTQANTWYFVAAEVPNGTALGLDGVVDGYPRAYGRKHFPATSYADYYNPFWDGDRANTNNMTANGGTALIPYAFDGTGSYDVDSVVYSTQKGLIPALPFTVTNHVNKVNNVVSDLAKFELFPNPSTDYINVTVGLNNTAKQVTYTVLSSGAKVMSKVAHTNVLNETYTLNTNNLPSGVYYMVVDADGKNSFKKFTVIR